MISAGIMFAALSTSGNTFGSEWVVHERESRSGTSTLAYFFAKAAFDIPKVAIYSTAYMAGFTSFYSMRQPYALFCFHVLYVCFSKRRTTD